MNAEKHYQKGLRFDRSQLKLDPIEDSEALVESCYMAAHHFLLAGAEWRGFAHAQSHAHRDNAGLLGRQVKAPQAVQDAWSLLDNMRPGSIYGARSGAQKAQKRERRSRLSRIGLRRRALIHRKDAVFQAMSPRARKEGSRCAGTAYRVSSFI